MALEALGTAEGRVVGRFRFGPVQNPAAFFGCGERVQFFGGMPYLEASYFELNPQTSPVDWYAAVPRQKSSYICSGVYFVKRPCHRSA